MPWFVIILIVIVFLLASCLAISIPLVRHRPIKELHTPEEFQLPFEEVTFRSADGNLLSGYWIPSTGSDSLVILLHGYAGSFDPDLRYAPFLHAAGYNVLMFDFRAHGRSGGHLTSLGACESRDVQAAILYALTRGITRIGLLGFSMGGRAAMLAAPYPPQVKAIISDGAPARLLTAVHEGLVLKGASPVFARLFAGMGLVGASLLNRLNLFRRDPLYQTPNLKNTPLLLIYGALDRFTSEDERNTLLSSAGPNCRLWLVPEAKHRDIEESRPEEYIQVVLDFLKANLSSASRGGLNETI